MDSLILKVINAGKKYSDGYGENSVFKDVNLSLNNGETMAIVGPSGCGKTSLLQAIAGLDSITSGSIELLGHDLNRISSYDLAKLRNGSIGFVYQKSHLLPDFNLQENIALPLMINGDRNADNTAMRILEKLELQKFSNFFPKQISGGMQQKVAIGRAIANKPKIVFADEPTGNLDINSKQIVLDTLFDLSKEYGAALCIVTHDDMVAKRADKIENMLDLNRPNRI